MRATVEISMYPLNPDYESKILSFIELLKAEDDLMVRVNETSTHVSGDYDLIFNVLRDSIRQIFQAEYKSVFVLKILGMDLLGD